MTVRIFVREIGEKDWDEITDLYWFEENGVHGFDDKCKLGACEGHYGIKYEFRFLLEVKS